MKAQGLPMSTIILLILVILVLVVVGIFFFVQFGTGQTRVTGSLAPKSLMNWQVHPYAGPFVKMRANPHKKWRNPNFLLGCPLVFVQESM
jgi:flagellar basal body-associated protein FliL